MMGDELFEVDPDYYCIIVPGPETKFYYKAFDMDLMNTPDFNVDGMKEISVRLDTKTDVQALVDQEYEQLAVEERDQLPKEVFARALLFDQYLNAFIYSDKGLAYDFEEQQPLGEGLLGTVENLVGKAGTITEEQLAFKMALWLQRED